MRDNARRRAEYKRRKLMCEQLRLQADILCESHREEGRQTVVLGRMMNIILDLVGTRGLNETKRQILADHFTDCGYRSEGMVMLGGEGERNTLYLDGAFRIDELAKRFVWSDVRAGQTIEV